ncbi:MAG: hypothetical protein ACLRWQ_10350 [Flavonifractor plautii]
MSQSFRGTPILPWDLSALGTAADVAGSYRFTPTWQMLAAVALAVGSPGCVPPSGETQGSGLRLTGTRRPLRLVCLGAGHPPPAPVPHRAAGAFRVLATDVRDPAGSYRAGALPGGIPPQHGVPRGGGAGGRHAGAAGTDHGRRGAAGAGGGFRGAAQH